LAKFAIKLKIQGISRKLNIFNLFALLVNTGIPCVDCVGGWFGNTAEMKIAAPRLII